MALDAGAMKTEHNGAKNGGGAWCKRVDAKEASNSRRRIRDRELSLQALRHGESD